MRTLREETTRKT